MIIKKSLKIIIAVAAFVLINSTIYANDDHEKVELARLLVELHALERIIQTAKHSADPEDRIQFDYEALQNDLTSIQNGIEDYINTVRRDPRKLPTIKGDYRD